MLSLSVLRLRDFRILLFARICGTMALQAQAVIAGWQIYSLTKDTFLLGVTGLVEAAPALTCALVAGHVVDNNPPYRVLLTCLGVLAFNLFILALVAGGLLPVPGSVVLWIFAGVFISGLVRSFMMPSSFALQPQIVPRDEIPAASAWLTGGLQIGVIVGPALAGVIFGQLGAAAAWSFPLVLMVSAFLLGTRISASTQGFHPGRRDESAIESIRAGWGFILKNRAILSVISLDMFAVLFGGAVAMLPAFADQVLHTGSHGLGALRGAPAVGALLTTLFLALRPMRTVRGSLLLWAVAGFGAATIAFGLSSTFWVAFACLALTGAFDSVSVIIRQTLVQWLTPKEMRGRVSSVNSMFIISSNEIGAFESGAAARLLGLVPSIVWGGIGTLLVVLTTCITKSGIPNLSVSHKDEEETA